jgi:hypothetical protein
MEFSMLNTTLRIALAFVAFSLPATAFAQGGAAGLASRGAIIGTAEMLEQSARNNNVPAVAPIPPPRITVPKIPQFK